jgi:hypothetical protein
MVGLIETGVFDEVAARLPTGEAEHRWQPGWGRRPRRLGPADDTVRLACFASLWTAARGYGCEARRNPSSSDVTPTIHLRSIAESDVPSQRPAS